MLLPTLTGALRAFSTVTLGADDADSVSYDNDDLAERRRLRAQKEMEQGGLGWRKLVSAVERHAKVDKQRITSALRDLTRMARELVGAEVTSEVTEAGAAMLFETFCGSELVTQTQSGKLRALFGPFPASLATKACSLVNRMADWLPEEIADNLTKSATINHSEPVFEFGRNIKFVFDEPHIDDFGDEKYDWLDSDDEDEAPTAAVNFDMRYTGERPMTATSTAVEKEKVNAGWLKHQVLLYFGGEEKVPGMSVGEVCATIFDMLSSNYSDTELQNELFDLLGFDCFELIQSLLEKRQSLVEATYKSATDVVMAQHLSQEKSEAVRPNYGCQVTVQSEEEKQYQRLKRREEKKIAKKGGQEQDYIQSLNFDPQLLRAQRESALLAAIPPPRLTRGSQPKVKYPFVFDAYSEAQQSSAYIGGNKMLLPEGFDRENGKMYEEVNIPSSIAAPTNVGKKLIDIADLDEIGQIAFKGTKSLNRIQSVVFDAAYKSNENLLVCAPTGAGKTNIAMLTVIHEIMQHIQQGVIKKDEFKIIYVAPMKALAAEMVRNFGRRLEPLGITVKELTGDMQLTKMEIMKTQMLVTTPEKWDVVTRKSTGDVALTQLVRLLIIDEVHLLHDDRGAVIETLVARTLRQVESSQSLIRILGLSATLPNYIDVARFLCVNPQTGLFFFDGRFRPVPLAMTFIGVKALHRMQQLQDYNTICYEKALKQVKQGYQVMVFVHARNETVRTATVMREQAKNKGDITFFTTKSSPRYGEALKQFSRSRNRQMQELFPDGFGIHHAGMLRQDRNLVERYFAEGFIKVLVCTATLAWGVNLPAHAVIIKGTQIYHAKKGTFVDLGILDVMQIFGRAGRPQYDTFGSGTIITEHDKLAHYLSLLTQQNPIESQFINSLTDNLNAEVSLGTVTNVEEGAKWLSYTYLYVRMRHNPMVYGVPYKTLEEDPTLEEHRRDLIVIAGRSLDKAKMIRFVEGTGYMYSTDLGRTASHFYIKFDTVEVFNDMFKPMMTEDKVLEMVSKAQEFEQIKVRDEELEELDFHLSDTCVLPVAGGSENAYGKVNILLQTYIGRGTVNGFSLISDQAYVAQNAARIVRGLFEVALHKGWPLMAGRLLQLSKIIERRLWGFENPLRQFTYLPVEILNKIEARKFSLDMLRDASATDIGHMVHHVRMGSRVKQCVDQIPALNLEASIQPITRTVLRVRLELTPEFQWSDRVHGMGAEPFWVWVEDPENNHIYHSEYFMMHKKHVMSGQAQQLIFTIPIFEPLPTQYYVRAISDRWLGAETVCAISFQHLILPERHPPHTELLDLQPLPVSALNDPGFEALMSFSHFNPIQTQIFHVLFHTDSNVLLGAPTGSGKTVAAELAIFRVFKQYPKAKAVYIAPLKALVRERMDDWKVKIEGKLGKKVVELTGDVTPDMRAVSAASLIVTTPEKWDGISRSWQTRNYVKDVAVLIIDEIHLLGNDRGPVLEVIVSRANFISSHTEKAVRVVGLSTALANARDLADWLSIKQMGLFNFRPSVRPVPLEVHISGYPGKHYCPRMATMNKPTFQAIRTHSPAKPVLVFVSSRRQTRLTALDLIAYLAAEDNPKQWLHMEELEMENLIVGIRETNLKLTLAFGIGLHHAGLHERDRKTVEELFVNQKIQVLIATSTLAWGVNFPAHLVVIKGTEYFDGKTKRYVDFPITDVLQMMGRAGRPQFDDQGKAVILVHDVKKHFYKKFLYEPFPVESNLLEVLSEHLNAEVVAGTIASKQDAMDYITWTYFFRRLLRNPSYYHLDDINHDIINRYLSTLVERALSELQFSYCVELAEDNHGVIATTLGRIASYYYLHHSSVKMFRDDLSPSCTIPDVIQVLAMAHEYNELPVRHNEDHVNSELAKLLPLPVDSHSYDSSNTKAHLLLQAHFSQQQLPSSDYHTDTKSVLDQAIRILQAMLDVSADQGWLVTSLHVIHLIQMVVQGRWLGDNTLLCLPHVQPSHLPCFIVPGSRRRLPLDCLPELMQAVEGQPQVLSKMLAQELPQGQINQIYDVLVHLPVINVSLSLKGWWERTEGEQATRRIPQNVADGGRHKDDLWMPVHADQEYVLSIDLRRVNKVKSRNTHAYSPRFSKPKDEGWILVLGEVDSREVIAVKRVGYRRGQSSVQLAFYSPESMGRVIYTLYLMSDCYLGLDQQYDVCLNVVESNLKAQVNSELLDMSD